MRSHYRRDLFSFWFAVAVALSTGAAGVVAWLIVRHQDGWTETGKVGAIALAVTGFGVVSPPIGLWLAGRRVLPSPPDLDRGRLESWQDLLRRLVAGARFRGEGSQLNEMLRWGPAMDLRARGRLDFAFGDDGRPRLQVGGRTMAWSQLGAEWERSGGRLILLGEPGYGKTVAALTLVKHISAGAQPEAPVAELFSLAEWYRWHGQHSGHRFSDWLADQLCISYPDIPPIVARGLVDAGLVLPLLDGFDEVPVSHRLTCKATIDAYAEKSPPFRSFVLTCRAEEYRELAPDWVRADQVVGLVGLQDDQIAAVLEAETAGRAAWTPVRQRIAEGDTGLLRLFRSPLRLAIALQTYRTTDPSELVGVDTVTAQARLWNLLLALDTPTFEGAGPTQIRSWLAFLAAGMVRHERQRFWLHELYLYVPKRRAELRMFALVVAVTIGVAYGAAFGVAYGAAFGLGYGLPVGLSVGVASALACGLASARNAEHPRIYEFVSWRGLRRDFRRKAVPALRVLVPCVGLYFGLRVGLSQGLLVGLAAAVLFGLLLGVLFGLTFALLAMAGMGIVEVGSEPPQRLTANAPTTILAPAKKQVLISGLCFGLAVGLPAGVPVALVPNGLVAALNVALVIGLVAGLYRVVARMSPWLYNHWLRRSLSRWGCLPSRLTVFLQWCAEPPRNWLRVTDAYEFRHRDLQDHLAASHSQKSPTTSPQREMARPD